METRRPCVVIVEGLFGTVRLNGWECSDRTYVVSAELAKETGMSCSGEQTCLEDEAPEQGWVLEEGLGTSKRLWSVRAR